MRRRFLFLVAVIILTTALAGCQGKVSEPSDETTPETIIRNFGADEASWRAWDDLHENDLEWMDAAALNIDLTCPLSCGTVFFCESGAAVTPDEAAKILISSMLDSMGEDSNERQFTILDYAVPDQILQTRADVITSALGLLESGEAPSERADLEEWCRFYFGQFPGIDDNMWFLYPDFSIRWSGQCGISEYDEFIGGEEMDENGLVPISYTLARSLEANIFLLAQTDGGYYLQSVEAFYASHTYA